MGMYTWLSDEEFERYSSVTNKELNEIFQDVRAFMPDVYIREIKVDIRKWYQSKPKLVVDGYYIYTRMKEGDSEVRCMNLPASNSGYVANYLFGLFNGYHYGLTPIK